LIDAYKVITGKEDIDLFKKTIQDIVRHSSLTPSTTGWTIFFKIYG